MFNIFCLCFLNLQKKKICYHFLLFLWFQRLNRLTKHVFTNVHLSELRLAVQDMFELFFDILTDPINSYSELKAKIEAVVSIDLPKNVWLNACIIIIYVH